MLNLDKTYFRGHAPPEVVLDDLFEICRRGYVTIGILGALFKRNPYPQLLMLSHKETNKNRKGQLGPLGELVKVLVGENGQAAHIETPLETLARGFLEEVGVLPEGYLSYLGYFLSERLVGDGSGTALAICPVFDCGEGLWIPRTPDTKEISQTRFMHVREILETPTPKLRVGVKRFAREASLFLKDGMRSRQTQFELPAPTEGQWEDLSLPRHAPVEVSSSRQ